MFQQNVDSSARRSTRKKNCPRKKTLKKCWQGANFEIAIFSIKKTLKIFWQGANFEITTLGRGLKTKSWNIKTRLAELGVFMAKFAIENDPKP